jgi:hypothetical protein
MQVLELAAFPDLLQVVRQRAHHARRQRAHRSVRQVNFFGDDWKLATSQRFVCVQRLQREAHSAAKCARYHAIVSRSP